MSRNVGYAGAKEEDGAACAKAAYRADDPSTWEAEWQWDLSEFQANQKPELQNKTQS